MPGRRCRETQSPRNVRGYDLLTRKRGRNQSGQSTHYCSFASVCYGSQLFAKPAHQSTTRRVGSWRFNGRECRWQARRRKPTAGTAREPASGRIRQRRFGLVGWNLSQIGPDQANSPITTLRLIFGGLERNRLCSGGFAPRFDQSPGHVCRREQKAQLPMSIKTLQRRVNNLANE